MTALISTAAGVVSSPRPSQAPAGVINAFRGRILRLRPSFFYGIALIVVTAAMVVLPVLYLGLIGLVAYAVYWHAVENIAILHSPSGGFSIRMQLYVFLAYLAPFAIGALIIFFMLKPLLARRVIEHEPLTLDPAQEPLLFAVLEKLCETIGSPMPRQIEVDCRLNASASLRRGFVSFFGRDLTLSIGLPLAAGMTLQQFIGVLSHELGHFSQGFGMRLSYVVRRINAWFARVAYERDEWDVWIAETSREGDARIAIVLVFARAGIWMSRKVLWGLMILGHLISCMLLRQMEYDADRVAAQVIGSDAYANGLKRLAVLQVACEKAHSDLAAAWREQRLADNLPALIAMRVSQLHPQMQCLILEHSLTVRSGFADTHPSISSRLAALPDRPLEGVFRHDAPATALFANFRMIACAVTLSYYRRGLELQVERQSLIPTEMVLEQAKAADAERTATARYFANCFSLHSPVRLGIARISCPTRPRASATLLWKTWHHFERSAESYAKHYEEHDQAFERFAELNNAEILLAAGFKRLDKKSFDIRRSTPDAISEARAATEAVLAQVRPKVETMNKVLRMRLLAALRLACTPQVQEKLALDEDPEAVANRLLPALAAIEENLSDLSVLRRDFGALVTLLDNAPTEGDVDELFPGLRPVAHRLAREMRNRLQDVRFRFESVSFPFEHAAGNTSIANEVLKHLPPENAPPAVARAVESCFTSIVELHLRILGRLVLIAERVEQVFGMKPPEKKKEGQAADDAS